MLNDKLINAIENQDPDKALYYLSERANPNSKDEYDDSALYLTFKKHSYEDFLESSDKTLNKYVVLAYKLIEKGAKTKTKKSHEFIS